MQYNFGCAQKPEKGVTVRMILSASRRTDIPRYYSEWFMNRIRAGYVLTRNPMNHSQVSRISLSPAMMDCIVFWTKDASPLVNKLPELDERGYRCCFQYTITPYGQDIEPRLRPKDELTENFRRLSRMIGKERMRWRYDPVLLNERYTPAFHARAFESLCAQLCGFTDTVVISFIDLYAKIKKTGLQEIPGGMVETLSQSIGQTAKKYGLHMQTCCEKADLTSYGIRPGACLEEAFLEAACGYALEMKPDKGQRTGCNCMESIDIGAYNTCPGGCVYCYATSKLQTAESNYSLHDPQGEFLSGTLLQTDTVYDRKQKSLRRDAAQLEWF